MLELTGRKWKINKTIYNLTPFIGYFRPGYVLKTQCDIF